MEDGKVFDIHKGEYDFGGRSVAFKAQVGSHNYNLNDETSDKDYKYFVLPTFHDLYYGKMFSTAKIGKQVDFDVHDIRKLGELLWKANINFLEVLYSKDIQHTYKAGKEERKYWQIEEIFNMKKELVTMNLPYLFKACKGMYFEKMKRLEKGTEGTIHLVEKYGYDTKQALHAFRVMNFCVRFRMTNWDFEHALVYEEDARNHFLAIKNGKYSLERVKEEANKYYNKVFIPNEVYFLAKEPKEEVRGKLENLIESLVKENLG